MYGSAAEMPGAATLWRSYRMCAGYDTLYMTNPPKDDSTQQPRTTGIAKRATTICFYRTDTQDYKIGHGCNLPGLEDTCGGRVMV